MANNKQKLVEITRSFSYKLNLGNYQTADFFCSQKAEVKEKDAEKISEALYKFCKSEVIKSVNKYIKENKVKKPAIKLSFKDQQKGIESQIDNLKEGQEEEEKIEMESKLPDIEQEVKEAEEINN